MDKRTSGQEKRHNRNAIMILLPDEEFEALRTYCFEKRVKHGPFVRQILAERLRQESYLKKEARKS